MLKLVAAAILNVAALSLLFCCSETVPLRNEKSLLCGTLICDLIVKVLCWYDNVCLMRIVSIDNLTNNIHVDTPAQAFTWDIANESLSWDINWLNWLQCQDVGLPVVGWHNRRGQHDWVSNDARPWKWVVGANVLGRMCLYAPYCWVAWQTRSARVSLKQCKAIKMGCWGRRVESDVSLCTILLIEIGWHNRRGQHSWVAKWFKAMKTGC